MLQFERSAYARFCSSTRTYPVFVARRAGQCQPPGGQGNEGRHARHRGDRPRQHVRHQGVHQLRQQEEQRSEGRNQGPEEENGRHRERQGGVRGQGSRAGRLPREDCRGGSPHLQAHHRLRDVRGATHDGQEGGQARPERLPPGGAGQEREGLPQPHQAGVARLDQRLLHASAYRPQRAGEVSRGPDCLLRLPGWRNPQEDNQRQVRRGREPSAGTRTSSATTSTWSCNATRPPCRGPTTRPIPCSRR